MSLDKTVLVVEDDIRFRTILVDKLGHEGFNVITAKDGEDGMNTALSVKPDLILLDLLMPKMGGLSFMSHLRADKWGASVPIIVFTNLEADDKILQNIVENKPAYYFIKTNFPLNNLVSKIKELLHLN